MIRTGIGLGFGGILALIAWRNVPTFGEAYVETFILAVLLALFVSWSAGRYWRGRDHERAVAAAAAMAAVEVRAEIKSKSEANAQAAAVVNVQQNPGLVTPEQVAEQWGDDEPLDPEIAAHYANEINRERWGVWQGPVRPVREPEPEERKVLYLPSSSKPPS